MTPARTLENERQRARPEVLGERARSRRHLARPLRQRRRRGQMHDERMIGRPALGCEDTTHRTADWRRPHRARRPSRSERPPGRRLSGFRLRAESRSDSVTQANYHSQRHEGRWLCVRPGSCVCSQRKQPQRLAVLLARCGPARRLATQGQEASCPSAGSRASRARTACRSWAGCCRVDTGPPARSATSRA